MSNPMMTGGSPNNSLTLTKYENHLKDKAVNPFKTNDLSRENTVIKETSHLGPGLYSPQYRNEIGGSEFQKSRKAMFSTLTAAR